MNDLIDEYENCLVVMRNRKAQLRRYLRNPEVQHMEASLVRARIETIESEEEELIYSIVDMKKHKCRTKNK